MLERAYPTADQTHAQTDATQRAASILSSVCAILGDGSEAYNFHDTGDDVRYHLRRDGWITAHAISKDALRTHSDAALITATMYHISNPSNRKDEG